ncbi:PREDICTED: uncharacterized protein LOC106816139 [Priapulus caudatus]|uniref:Uncharacterized protein LOC106816139 n=1 Tax=Priapulus caudatus TaxID=37621 RepID=A0ABM1EVF9_PRICU|nr:PREDICTED: uncharacterized protein LOC106816139 [Priapulus caudatus]
MGMWQMPAHCEFDSRTPSIPECRYRAMWAYNAQNDSIRFGVQAKNYGLDWTGIGFSRDRLMPDSDVVYGWVSPETGNVTLIDGHLDGYGPPRPDVRRDVTRVSGSLVNGITSLQFWRPRATGDRDDVQFTDDDCFYFLFPYDTNRYKPGVMRHRSTPMVSEQRICIRPCMMMMMMSCVCRV